MTFDAFKAAVDSLAAQAAASRWDNTVTLAQARARVDGQLILDWYRREAGLVSSAAEVLGEVLETLTDAEHANVIASLAGDRCEAGRVLQHALIEVVARDVQERAQAVADAHEINAIFNEGHRPSARQNQGVETT